MNNCTGCKNKDSWAFKEPCTSCSRAYMDKWEPRWSDMSVEEAIEFLHASQVFPVLSAREKEAINVLIRAVEDVEDTDPYQADMDEAWEQAKEAE